MTTFSSSARFATLQRLSVLCALLAAASAHAGYGGTKDPPAGMNGWTPAVITPAQVAVSAVAVPRALPKSGR